MEWTESHKLQCPYCFEFIDVEVDPSAGGEQEWVYDCEVCCRPIVVRVQRVGADEDEGSEGELVITGERES